jgi:hypothetical protein
MTLGAGSDACNPNYSGGRDQEDHSSKLDWETSSERPYLEKPFTKIELVEWLKVKALCSKTKYCKKKKNYVMTFKCVSHPVPMW